MKKRLEFFNRDLSWIEFNARVLAEAQKKQVPLLERLRFLTIVTSNFDEFFMVRVASLKHQGMTNSDTKDSSGLSVKDQLKRISDRTHTLTKLQYACLNERVLPQLASEGITYTKPAEYTPEQNRFLRNMFNEEIFPLLTPLRTEKNQAFPHIANLKMHFAFLLKPHVSTTTQPDQFAQIQEEKPIAIVQIPTSLNRIIWFQTYDNQRSFTLLDDVIGLFAEKLFPGYSIEESLIFKIIRDADFGVDEEKNNDFIQAMQEVLVQRQSSLPIRMTCSNVSPVIRNILKEQIGLDEKDIYEIDGIIDLSSLQPVCDIEGFSKLKYPSYKPIYPIELSPDKYFWDTLKQKDVLINVPYESFDPIIKFIQDASNDENVLAIKMTLYRTSGNSPIVHALENAALQGKQVTVFVELKARFDEKRNISWASQLEKAGVIVVYGIANLKVHAKLILIVRKEETGIYRYVHLSTGNYNEKTAKTYSDLSILTTNSEIANDATLFFNMISGYSTIQTMKLLKMAPIDLRKTFLGLIEREISSSTESFPGFIMAKMNSLADVEIIKALYRASQSHVKVLLNVRGICMLIPGVTGLSENIKVISIIDRFLEHSRIFFFQNGGSEELYLSSADLMNRNLDKRVELLFPVVQDSIFKKIKNTLSLYFKDTSNATVLQKDGTWIANKPKQSETPVRAQEQLYQQYKLIDETKRNETPKEFIVRRTESK